MEITRPQVEYLAPRGFATKNIASLPHVTVAGVLATGTHGTGLTPGYEGCLTAQCAAIEFVTADGQLRMYKKGDKDFPLAVVHLGALGVVSRVTLDVVPAFTVTQHVYRGHIPLQRLFGAYHSLAHSCDSFTTGINFGTGEVTLWLRYFQGVPGGHTPPQDPPPPTLLGGDAEGQGEACLHLLQGRVPFYELGPGAEGVQTTRTGPWHDVPTFFMDGGKERDMPCVALQSEFFVPLDRAAEALEATAHTAAQWPGWLHADNAKGTEYEAIPLVFHCEVRCVASDGLAGLSPFADRPALAIHFTWGHAPYTPHIMELVAQLQDSLRPFGVRPHWGKLNSLVCPELEGLYPPGALAAFRALAKEHDPQGKFINGYLKGQLFH